MAPGSADHKDEMVTRLRMSFFVSATPFTFRSGFAGKSGNTGLPHLSLTKRRRTGVNEKFSRQHVDRLSSVQT